MRRGDRRRGTCKEKTGELKCGDKMRYLRRGEGKRGQAMRVKDRTNRMRWLRVKEKRMGWDQRR